MRKYNSYEKTSIPWTPMMPSHWHEFRSKRLFSNNKEKNTGNTESNVLSLTLKGVIRNDKERPIGLSRMIIRHIRFLRRMIWFLS